MPLNLDLSASDAKIARARVHLDELERKTRRVVQDSHPYTIRHTEIDPEAGLCEVFLRPQPIAEHFLGIIVGDLIHNLRSALDYIVTALVDKSNATLSTSHQFPIFMDKRSYNAKVGTESVATKEGWLRGVTMGLKQVWELQPFNSKMDPTDNPLAIISTFSNADKHRVIAEFIPLPANGSISVTNGTVIETEGVAESDINSTDEQFLGRFRFEAPYPAKPDIQSNIVVTMHFGTPSLGRSKVPTIIEASLLGALCDHVAMVTNLFKALVVPVAAHSTALWILWQVYNCQSS